MGKEKEKVTFTERKYFGDIPKKEGVTRIAFFMQYVESSKGRTPFLGISEERKEGETWKYGKAVTFPVRLLTEMQALLNGQKQEAIDEMTAPTLEKKDDPF